MSESTRGRATDVFTAFLRLGFTSFGGPVAHLEYLRREFVERRGWLDAPRFTQLLAICQVLPGPASSQLGFGIGLLRGGWAGAIAAFAGFTLPSALLLLVFAWLGSALSATVGGAIVHGLKLVAVAVVAHGVLRMATTLTPDVARRVIALVTLEAMLLLAAAWAQLLVIAAGAALGWRWCRAATLGGSASLDVPYGTRASVRALVAFFLLLGAALLWPVVGAEPTLAGVAAAFARAGALVFGGGHVVLPLLEESLVATGWMSADTFLAGYGAAQAVPGPLFSVAAYLGAQLPGASLLGAPSLGAGVALLALFAPGFLLLVAVLPAWSRLRALPHAGAVMAGINASVVGLLAAALVDPIFTSAVRSPMDLAVALAGFAFLVAAPRRSPLWVVAWCVAASWLLTTFGG
jgi:chromate transporter